MFSQNFPTLVRLIRDIFLVSDWSHKKRQKVYIILMNYIKVYQEMIIFLAVTFWELSALLSKTVWNKPRFFFLKAPTLWHCGHLTALHLKWSVGRTTEFNCFGISKYGDKKLLHKLALLFQCPKNGKAMKNELTKQIEALYFPWPLPSYSNL